MVAKKKKKTLKKKRKRGCVKINTYCYADTVVFQSSSVSIHALDFQHSCTETEREGEL